MLKLFFSNDDGPSYADKLCVFMMSLYLLADVASGFTVLQLGMDLKLSLLYKLPLTGLVLLLVLKLDPRYFIFLCLLLAILLMGPVLQLLSEADTFFYQ